MRSGATAALAMALAALTLLSSGLPAHGEPDLLIDDGFEAGVGDWRAGGVGTLDTTSAFAFEGACSAVLTPDNPGSTTVQYSPAVAIQPSADYTFSAYILKNDPQVQSVELQLHWKDQAGVVLPQLRDYTSRLMDNGPSWQLLSVTGAAPPEAVFVQPRIGVVFDGIGAVYIDSVKLEGPPPLPPTDTPAPTDTPTIVPQPSPQPSATTIPTVAATATKTKVPSATPIPSATPTTGPGSSLINGGFEDGDGDGPLGWSKYGGELQRSSAHAHSGRYSGAFSSNTTSTKWVYETVRLSGGSAYDFSGYVLLDDPGVSETYLRISWYGSDDGSGSALAASDSTVHLSGVDPSFRLLSTSAAVAPAAARSARLRVMLAPASDAPAIIYIDDMSFGPASVEAETPSPPAAAVEEPRSDIGVAAIIQRVAKPRATVAAKNVVRQATPPARELPFVAGAAVQRQNAGDVQPPSPAPGSASDDTRLRLLVSLAAGLVALVVGGSSGLFLARLNGRRL